MGEIVKFLGVTAIMVLLLGVGAVTPVAASEVTVSIDAPAEAEYDSEFTAVVVIDGVTDFDACNYDISFDATVLRLDSVESGLIESAVVPVDFYNEIDSGTYRIVQNIEDFPGVSGSGYLAILYFHVIGSEGDVSAMSVSNMVLSDITASEIEATLGDSSVTVAAVSQSTTPPPPVNQEPEAPVPGDTAVSPAGNPEPEAAMSDDDTPVAGDGPVPEAAAPAEMARLPDNPINWPVLWGVINGVLVVGLIIFLLVKKKA